MKKLFTLSLVLLTSLTYAQHVIIEAGPSFLKDYTPAINAGATFIFTKGKGSGAGIGAEVYKSSALPVGIPVFLRGVLISKTGFMLNLQAGYMFMSKEYDDGKAKLGGLYAKFGPGYAGKRVHLLVNFVGAQVEDSFHPGGNIMLGVRF